MNLITFAAFHKRFKKSARRHRSVVGVVVVWQMFRNLWRINIGQIKNYHHYHLFLYQKCQSADIIFATFRKLTTGTYNVKFGFDFMHFIFIRQLICFPIVIIFKSIPDSPEVSLEETWKPNGKEFEVFLSCNLIAFPRAKVILKFWCIFLSPPVFFIWFVRNLTSHDRRNQIRICQTLKRFFWFPWSEIF